MLASLVQKIFGTKNQKIIKKYKKTIDQINAFEPEMQKLSNADLAAQTNIFKEQIASGVTIDQILPKAFALVREASLRTLGMRHFDVQLLGGIVLHQGMIAEMKTGEGKTLVSTLAAYLNALSGKSVHIVTVNDYLAKRDADWMGQIYRVLGLKVACILNQMPDHQRQMAYQSDIVYATNNELGFDYLRDNMKFSRQEMVQQGLHFAIIDEVDSILIDEARTPLIISGPTDSNPIMHTRINKVAKKIREQDYIIDEKSKSISLTEEGQKYAEELLLEAGLLKNTESLYGVENLKIVHCLNQSLRAHQVFYKDKDYIVKNGNIVIIDEFTGRMMEGRRYSEGLHQALEAKENLKVNSENQTLASITFQNYFRMYEKLAGMTGTAKTEEEEFANIYGLRVTQVPTNIKVQRIDEDDEIYASEEEKLLAIVNFIKKCHAKGQPVLVGTVSIEKSEKLSEILKANGLKHSILNAKYHEQEAKIIAQAGKSGAITIATNMAGRGTDIQLGGNKELLISANDDVAIKAFEKEAELVCKAGGLCVIGTERHESRRIDNQLRGRSGRQGDPGRSKFFLSLEDDLLRIFGSGRIKTVLKKLGLKENEAIYHPWITKALEKAQKKVERRNYEIRKNLIKFDDVINSQRKVIFNYRNKIIDGNCLDIKEVAKEVNRSIFSATKSKNFYDTDLMQKMIQETYKIHLDNLDEIEDIEGYIEKKTLSLVAAKEPIHHNPKIEQEVKKRIMITALDQLWKWHLDLLDHLRVSVNLRTVAQKNPLNEFKHDAFHAFEELLQNWNRTIISSFLRLKIVE